MVTDEYFGIIEIRKDRTNVYFIKCNKCNLIKTSLTPPECIHFINSHMLNEHSDVYRRWLLED